MPPKKEVYSKKDQIGHLLLRPDTYVGSKRMKFQEEYVSEDGVRIIKKTINFSPAILRIFVEILSNSLDNVKRSKDLKIPCTTIKVSINKETGDGSQNQAQASSVDSTTINNNNQATVNNNISYNEDLD